MGQKPLFVRKESLRWEYFGKFKVDRKSTDPIEMKKHLENSFEKKEIKVILYLVPENG